MIITGDESRIYAYNEATKVFVKENKAEESPEGKKQQPENALHSIF